MCLPCLPVSRARVEIWERERERERERKRETRRTGNICGTVKAGEREDRCVCVESARAGQFYNRSRVPPDNACDVCVRLPPPRPRAAATLPPPPSHRHPAAGN